MSVGGLAELFGTFALTFLVTALLIVWREMRSLRAKVGRVGKEVGQLHQRVERLFLVSLQASRQEPKVTAGAGEKAEVVRLKPVPNAPE